MNKEALTEALKSRFEGTELEESFGMPCLVVDKKELPIIAHLLKEEKPFGFDMLVCETAVDRNEYFELLYHLRSVSNGQEMILKTKAEREAMPVLPSLCRLWPAAELFEDEIYDLFGIRFEGHPFLRRIMLDETFEGYPLRKDFVNTLDL